jgi:hypothetical protein
MKRFVAAIVILGLAALAAVCSHLLILQRINGLKEEARDVIQAALEKDTERAGSELDTITQSWEKANTALHMFVIHREMGEVELNLRALREYLHGGDWELFRETSVRLLEVLEHMQHSQEISLGNVF